MVAERQAVETELMIWVLNDGQSTGPKASRCYQNHRGNGARQLAHLVGALFCWTVRWNEQVSCFAGGNSFGQRQYGYLLHRQHRHCFGQACVQGSLVVSGVGVVQLFRVLDQIEEQEQVNPATRDHLQQKQKNRLKT